MGDVIIDGLTGANRLVILDANGKIPALDGSAVTNVAGANFSTGTIPVARLDTGTTAGKIVKLDGTAKLPAVSGAALTGVAGATKNASDPTLSTNPSGGVGTEWHNTTSGEVYVCTDATAGENVWKNVGEQSGNIAPFWGQGDNYGYIVAPGTQDSNIYKYSFTSDANAVDAGQNLLTARTLCGGASSTTHGYAHGGYIGSYINTIEKFQFNTSNNFTDVGDLTTTHHERNMGTMSQTYGYCYGGSSNSSPGHDTIEKYSFSTDGNATDVGNLVIHGHGKSSNCMSDTAAYAACGRTSDGGHHQLTQVDSWSFATDADATDVGDIIQLGATDVGGNTDGTYGYVCGGGSSSGSPVSGAYNFMERFAFSSTISSTDIGDLVYATRDPFSGSGATYGYTVGGYDTSWTVVNYIQKYSYASAANATDIADMVTAAGGGANCQY